MKKIIEVRDFSPPSGKEYMADEYPGLGLFRNPNTSCWYLVHINAGTKMVAHLGVGATPPIPLADYAEPLPEVREASITTADLLKAVAISQNPLLAKELLK